MLAVSLNVLVLHIMLYNAHDDVAAVVFSTIIDDPNIAQEIAMHENRIERTSDPRVRCGAMSGNKTARARRAASHP